jgi:hypothetical protein
VHQEIAFLAHADPLSGSRRGGYAADPVHLR